MEFFKIIFFGPVNDMKTTPGTSVSVLFVWGILAYGFFVTLPQLARAADLKTQTQTINELTTSTKALQGSVNALNQRLMFDGMRRSLEQLDQDLYAVSREILKARVGGGEASDFLLERQRQLNSRRNELQEKIAAMLRQNPDLVYQ